MRDRIHSLLLHYVLNFRSHTFVSTIRFNSILSSLVNSLKFLPSYYRTTRNAWLEGLYIDLLQKITFDKWLNRFLINSSYLFNERQVFDIIVRFYIDYIIFYLNSKTIWTFKSVSTVLSTLTLLVITLLSTISLLYMTYWLF